MTEGSRRTPHPSPSDRLSTFVRSTGVKMFLILTLALLPLGLIALVASLQAIRTADLEKEALLRVAVSQSARKLSSTLQSNGTAIHLALNSLSSDPANDGVCDRLRVFLTTEGATGTLFQIRDRGGRTICGATGRGVADLVARAGTGGPDAQLLGDLPYLVTRTRSSDGRLTGIAFYSQRDLDRAADPATALQSRRMTLRQGDRTLPLGPQDRALTGRTLSLTSRLDPPDLLLTMTVRDPPATLARTLSLFLPLLMWFAAAAIGWFVVNRLLIRPLVLLQRVVATYQPGEVIRPLERVRTPAQEIIALGETFHEISEDVATHEAEMEQSLAAQRKLTREVHHRVKNNLQIIASLINLHARSAHEPEAVEAYASIQRRVDALSVVHRNHFAELEENRGVGVRPLISELSASLRGTAPADARRFGIQIDSDDLHISQDVAVPVAFLITELVELAMRIDPQGKMAIRVRQCADPVDRARLEVYCAGLRASPVMTALLEERYGRVLTGLSRQLRAPLDHDGDEGCYRILLAILA